MTIRDNLKNCEIITQKRQLGISNKFYFAHDVREAVLEFETRLKANYGINEEYKKSLLYKLYKDIFGDFEK